MRHVGDVDTHFPQSLANRTDGNGVVEVLCVARVDSEGLDLAEVLASAYLLGGDARFQFAGVFFHLFRVLVRQSELGKDGVHLRVVLAALAQYVNDFALRIAHISRPVRYSRNDLVAVLAVLELVGRDEDVVKHRNARHDEEGCSSVDLQSAHVRFLAALNDFNDFAAHLLAASAFSVQTHFDLVARQSMVEVLVVYADAQPVVGVDKVASARSAVVDAFDYLAVLVEDNFPFFVAHNLFHVEHLVEDVYAEHLERVGGEFQCAEYLFERYGTSRVSRQVLLYHLPHFVLVELCALRVFLLSHMLLIL